MSTTGFNFKALRKDLNIYINAFQIADRLGGLIGAKLISINETEAVYQYTVTPEHYNPNGILHGGALFTAMDSCQGALMHYIVAEEFSRTVSGTATIRFEAPVLSGMISIRTTVNRREGRKYFVDSIATQDTKVIAKLEEVWIAIK